MSENSSTEESNRERFVRIAEARTNKILSMIRLLGNCSSRNRYDYTEEDIKIIFSSIEKELRLTKSKFIDSDTAEGKFSLRKKVEGESL